MSAPEPSPRGLLLLLRRGGGVWGIDSAAVDGLAAKDGGYRISVGGGALAADEILGVAENLSVRPPAPWLRRFFPETPVGLTVHGSLPVVVVDPRRPPAVLRLDEGEPADEGRD